MVLVVEDDEVVARSTVVDVWLFASSSPPHDAASRATARTEAVAVARSAPRRDRITSASLPNRRAATQVDENLRAQIDAEERRRTTNPGFGL